MMAVMAARLPLPTLLSQALVAFILEFDNEAEHRLPHRTTNYGKTATAGPAPWLASMVMWSNCMRFVTEQGITVRDVECRARARTNWNGMLRWKYIWFEPAPGDPRPKPPQSALMVRPTPGGRLAQQIWAPLADVIEARWRERFGTTAVRELCHALADISGRLDGRLPNVLPILKYGLFNQILDTRRCPAADSEVLQFPLPELLSRVLLAFALEYERESAVSLAIGANVLRLIEDDLLRVRDLPLSSGVSKQAIAMAVTFLKSGGYATVRAQAHGSRVSVLLLTPKGM